MLFEYMKEVQRLINDSTSEIVEPEDIIRYVNKARRDVAMRAECVRILTPISASVLTASITAPGHGYTNPSVTITPPDFPSGILPYPNGRQAVANITEVGGQIVNVGIEDGGAGYFQPLAIINDPTGSGAEVTLNLSKINQLSAGQEEYPFAAVDLSGFPGVAAIHMIRSVSVIYSNYRYSLPCYSFSVYQARIRQYPFQYKWVPTVCGQRGQGTNGTFLVYPIPSQVYQIEYDAFGIPSDMATDQDPEPIPAPWTDSVPFLGAYYAFNELQNLNAARYYSDEYDKWMHRHSGYARPGRATSLYGRW